MANQLILAQRALQTLRHYQMLSPDDVVIAGLSGGADSIALLHWLHQLQASVPFRLEAAHVNHMLRGEEANIDEAFCKHICAQWDIPLHAAHIDVAALAKERGVGIEEAGRLARYGFFAELAQSNSNQPSGSTVKIALAHTLSDRIETMLLNMKRGAALRGLCSIPPARKLSTVNCQLSIELIRPLIECSRAQVEAHCATHELPYRTDESNDDLRFRRNQIRHEVLPLLGLNDNAMRRMFRALEADEAYLLQQAHDREQEPELPEALRSRLLRQQLARAGTEPNLARIQQAGHASNAPAPVKERNITVDFEKLDCSCGTAAENCGTAAKKFTKEGLANCLDCDTIVGKLVVGRRAAGDRMHLCNGAGTKPLKKLFQERGVPPGERGQRVVLRDDLGICWLEGFGCAHRCRMTGQTRTLLRIHVREG